MLGKRNTQFPNILASRWDLYQDERCYLYSVIDSDVCTLDFQLRKIRNHQVTYMFIERLVKAFGDSTVLGFLPQIEL